MPAILKSFLSSERKMGFTESRGGGLLPEVLRLLQNLLRWRDGRFVDGRAGFLQIMSDQRVSAGVTALRFRFQGNPDTGPFMFDAT